MQQGSVCIFYLEKQQHFRRLGILTCKITTMMWNLVRGTKSSSWIANSFSKYFYPSYVCIEVTEEDIVQFSSERLKSLENCQLFTLVSSYKINCNNCFCPNDLGQRNRKKIIENEFLRRLLSFETYYNVVLAVVWCKNNI